MSELMAVGYADRDQAITTLNALRQMYGVWIEATDIVAVVRDRKGKLRLAEQGSLGAARTIPWSALWRGYLQTSASPGGRSSGSATRPPSSVGIPDGFVRASAELLDRGNSALIIWGRTSVPLDISEYLYASALDVERTPLTPAQDALLVSVLDVLGPV